MLLPGRLHPFIAWRIWLLTRIDVCWNSLSAFQPSCSAWAFPWSHPSFICNMSIHMAWLILPIPSFTLLRYSLRMLRVDIYAQPPPVWAPWRTILVSQMSMRRFASPPRKNSRMSILWDNAFLTNTSQVSRKSTQSPMPVCPCSGRKSALSKILRRCTLPYDLASLRGGSPWPLVL